MKIKFYLINKILRSEIPNCLKNYLEPCGQLTYPHCWASLLGSLSVLSAHSFASNWQLPFLTQRKGENGCYFMTNLHERMFSDVTIEPATVRIPGGCGSDWATAPGCIEVIKADIEMLLLLIVDSVFYILSTIFQSYQVEGRFSI